MKIKKECSCGKIYEVFPSRTARSKYCSKVCKYNNFKSKFAKEKNNMWVGDEVKYCGLHDYIGSSLGKPSTCSKCKKEGLFGKKIHWANKSGNYKREFTDWIRLCAKCHSQYDHLRGRYPEPWNKTKVEINCKFCYKKIRIKPYLAETKKFCSLTCYKLSRKKNDNRKQI